MYKQILLVARDSRQGNLLEAPYNYDSTKVLASTFPIMRPGVGPTRHGNMEGSSDAGRGGGTNHVGRDGIHNFLGETELFDKRLFALGFGGFRARQSVVCGDVELAFPPDGENVVREMASNENNFVEEAHGFRSLCASEEEGVIDRVVFGLGAERQRVHAVKTRVPDNLEARLDGHGPDVVDAFTGRSSRARNEGQSLEGCEASVCHIIDSIQVHEYRTVVGALRIPLDDDRADDAASLKPKRVRECVQGPIDWPTRASGSVAQEIIEELVGIAAGERSGLWAGEPNALLDIVKRDFAGEGGEKLI